MAIDCTAVLKSNPYHDAFGAFTSKDKAVQIDFPEGPEGEYGRTVLRVAHSKLTEQLQFDTHPDQWNWNDPLIPLIAQDRRGEAVEALRKGVSWSEKNRFDNVPGQLKQQDRATVHLRQLIKEVEQGTPKEGMIRAFALRDELSKFKSQPYVQVLKSNPYHDASGAFTSKEKAQQKLSALPVNEEVGGIDTHQFFSASQDGLDNGHPGALGHPHRPMFSERLKEADKHPLVMRPDEIKKLIVSQDTVDVDLMRGLIDSYPAWETPKTGHLPIVTVGRGGKKYVTDGHHRLAAAALLNKSVKYVKVDVSDLPEPTQEEYAAAMEADMFGRKRDFVRILKTNPYHDAEGEFTTKDKAVNKGTARIGSLSNGVVDALSIEESQQLVRDLADVYKNDADFRGACDIVSKYASLDQETGLMVREIVAQSLSGKSSEEVVSNTKVQKLVASCNKNVRAEYQMTSEGVKNLATASRGYYATLREVQPIADTIYRGISSMKAEIVQEFELRGPTAFSHSRDVAMTYATGGEGRKKGQLIEVRPGVKALPTRLLDAAKTVAAPEDSDEEKWALHATAPVFYKRPDDSPHPLSKGSFFVDMDTDRELTSSGRFKVVGKEERSIAWEDERDGKNRTRMTTVWVVEQVGVF